jgi:hypothetical protein
VLLAGGLIAVLSVMCWVQRQRYPFLLVGWLWYCGTLVPVSQVVRGDSGDVILFWESEALGIQLQRTFSLANPD